MYINKTEQDRNTEGVNMAIINKIVSGKYFAVLAITIFVTTGTINAAELEEIIVTAQKRAESLQDVPISVTTLAGVKMQQAGINKIEDLQQFVPNLQMTETGISTQVYTPRVRIVVALIFSTGS